MGMAFSKDLKDQMQFLDKSEYTPVNEFRFMDPFESDITNGLLFDGIYIPQEIVSIILSFIPPNDLLELTLVCKMWCNLIKSDIVWMSIYERTHRIKAKNLPWYVYYCYFTTNNFKNLIRNGNGENKFQYWYIVKNLGDGFKIEDPPAGSDPLPKGIQDFNGYTSCFSTSYYECIKYQDIGIWDKRLLRYIIRMFKPHIYASEWVAGRFDCGCMYQLVLTGFKAVPVPVKDVDFNEHVAFNETTGYTLEQWMGQKWEKVEIIVRDYPENIFSLRFQHEGRDTQFWKGHYGSKMAGGVVKFLFDSIEPMAVCDEITSNIDTCQN